MENKQIIRNRDEKGNILTYSVEANFKINGKPYMMEFNTLKEARLMARED